MKFFVYLVSFILILALAGLFILKKPNGQAWFTVDDLLPKMIMIENKLESITDNFLVKYESFTKEVKEESSQVEQRSELKIYRWKDNNGNWSYSDKPKASAENEEIFLDPNDVVVLPALKVDTKNLPNAKASKKDDKISPSPLTVLPSKALNLYKDANNVQKLMDERQKNISKAIKDSTG